MEITAVDPSGLSLDRGKSTSFPFVLRVYVSRAPEEENASLTLIICLRRNIEKLNKRVRYACVQSEK